MRSSIRTTRSTSASRALTPTPALADFYADANGFLANPNRTVSPVTLANFQVKYLLQPGQTTPPFQQLDVRYTSGYFQDQWQPRSNLTVTAGIRVDVPRFGNTAFDNPAADALTFRDQDGSPVQYDSGKLPDTTPYWSPRVGFNWDVGGDGNTQVRGGTGLFTGKPPFVWISNQIGNTGVLYGFLSSGASTEFPFNPNPDKYKPAATGRPASSYELNVTDASFRFPQTWRTNIGADQRLPWGLIGTGDFIYNNDRNAPVYINANLPPAESAYTGVDNRPRWVATAAYPACITSGGPFGTGGQVGPCVTRLNNAVGNSVTANYVIKNQNQNHSWNIAGSLSKTLSHGFSARGGYSYGVSRSVVEPSSTAGSSWGSANPIVFDANNPPLAYSQNSPRGRVFLQTTYSHQYFSWGSTTVSAFYEGHPTYNLIPGTSTGQTSANGSYIFSGDANGDGQSNDLIYIPLNATEMNFKPLTVSGRTYSAADQAAAFEQYIQNDPYLSSRRGQYAERGGVFYPWVNRIDLSIVQDVFHSIGEQEAHRTDQARRHQLREPVESQLGCRDATHQPSDSDESVRGRQRRAHVQPSDLERQPVDEPVSDVGGPRRRLRVDAEFPLHVQLALDLGARRRPDNGGDTTEGRQPAMGESPSRARRSSYRTRANRAIFSRIGFCGAQGHGVLLPPVEPVNQRGEKQAEATSRRARRESRYQRLSSYPSPSPSNETLRAQSWHASRPNVLFFPPSQLLDWASSSLSASTRPSE